MMPTDTDLPIAAGGLLGDFAAAGAIGWSGVHLARTLGWLSGESRPEVLLACALCLRAQDAGSVCLPLDTVDRATLALEPTDDQQPGLTWPDADQWLALLASSPLVAVGESPAPNQRPLRLVNRLLYLERNWQAEEQVRTQLLARLEVAPPDVDAARLERAIEQAFRPFAASAQRQQDAVATSATSWTSVIAGGPGTGKTTTIAQLLRVLDDLADRRMTVALAAFTGKAAARMQQSLDASLDATGMTQSPWQYLQVRPASTLHSLLAARPHGKFGRNADNPLPYDLLVVDEMSMVSLDLMAALLAALRPSTRLVMVGDPHQLASVDAGAVLADIVEAGLPVTRVPPGDSAQPASAITVLDHSHRFSGPIQQLADAVRQADSERVLDLLASAGDALAWVEVDPDPDALIRITGLADDVVTQGRRMHAAAVAGLDLDALAALDAHRILCAHRRGRYGVSGWSRAVEQLLRSRIAGYGREGEWYLGRPVLITRNSADLQIANGDTGVVTAGGDGPVVALSSASAARRRSPWLLDSVETMHALTVHKSQGSEYHGVTLVLPSADSPLLTRELLYTALTRARLRIRVVATADSIAQAIATPARRATGLGARLRADSPMMS